MSSSYWDISSYDSEVKITQAEADRRPRVFHGIVNVRCLYLSHFFKPGSPIDDYQPMEGHDGDDDNIDVRSVGLMDI